MKTQLHIIVLCLVCAFLTSCASGLERRIKRNPDLFAKLSEADKQAVKSGQIKEGMSKEAVFFLWGRPSRVSEGTREGKKFERWNYTDYDTVVMNDFGYGIGGPYGRWGRYDPYFYGGPTIASVPVPGASIEFVAGKVSGFLLPRR